MISLPTEEWLKMYNARKIGEIAVGEKFLENSLPPEYYQAVQAPTFGEFMKQLGLI